MFRAQLATIVVVYTVRLFAGEAMSLGVTGKTMLHDGTSGTTSILIDVIFTFAGPAFILRVTVQTLRNVSLMRTISIHMFATFA